ncbi:MAG: type IV pilus secretin PilQ [Betaproteobacteria bacterium]|nr:type IV pilus secretin PilQ [Betaproteobacteria bacterium]
MNAIQWIAGRTATAAFKRFMGASGLSLLAVVCACPTPAVAENFIESVTVLKGSAGRTVVKLAMQQDVASTPGTFTVDNPPRIAFDFADTKNSSGRNLHDVGEKGLRNINVVEAGGRTRVVLNLNKPQRFETSIEGKGFLITVFDPPQQGAVGGGALVSHFSAPTRSAIAHAVRDIDFRRGKNGEARIIVDLSDSSVGIDIRQQGKSLLIDLIKTAIPRNLERRLDVGDFGTPVAFLDAFAQGDGTRIVIEPTGLWEHSAYQTENRFILEVKPIVEDPTRLTQGTRSGFKGEKLSLNFQNVEVRSVLQVIADFTGLNIITSDTVGGNLTLRLKDIPWDQALDIILQTKGLDLRKNGNVVLVAPREELAVKEEQELKSRQQISDLEPLMTETFQLNYQRAEAVQKILTEKDQKFLSKRGSAVVDARTNNLFVSDTVSRIEEVRRLITRIDISVRQVLVEARVVIADDRFSRQLGARFGTQGAYGVTNNLAMGVSGNIMGRSNYFTSNLVAGGKPPAAVTPYAVGVDDTYPLNVNLPVDNPAGSLALSFLNLGSGNLINLELQALEATNRGKVISNPRVITSNNQKAVIEQGTEIGYYVAGTATTGPTVQFKKAVLSLAVTPQITPDGRIIMTLEVRKDTVGANYSGVPSIDTKSVVTQIGVNNGDTAVLGGIYEEVSRNDDSKVPFLGDLPLIGHVFASTKKKDEKSELLIFITPRVISESVSAVR